MAYVVAHSAGIPLQVIISGADLWFSRSDETTQIEGFFSISSPIAKAYKSVFDKALIASN